MSDGQHGWGQFTVVLRRLAVVSAVVVVSLIGVGSTSAAAMGARLRVGSTAALPSGAERGAALSPAKRLQLTVALKPRDPMGLQELAQAVSSPTSPQFRDYLTVGQFAQRFGASPGSLSTVESTLRGAGLQVGAAMANHLTVPVTGTVAEVQKAFAVSEDEVRLRGGRVAYANHQAPTLPRTAAAHIQGVYGLNNVQLLKPALQSRMTSRVRGAAVTARVRRSDGERRLDANAMDLSASGPAATCAGAVKLRATPGESLTRNSGYTADQIASAYGISDLQAAGDTGAGQTIAIVSLEPYDPQDIATYQACYGTHVPVTNVPVDGGPGPYQPGVSDDIETAADIELLTSTAPGSSILAYNSPNVAGGIGAYSDIVSQDRATVISTSWGACDVDNPVVQGEYALFEEAALQGQTVFAASGDEGSSDCATYDEGQEQDTGLAADNPASQPFVTGVGGTTLSTGSGAGAKFYTPGSPRTESVWNDGNPSGKNPEATGGGLSSVWGMP